MSYFKIEKCTATFASILTIPSHITLTNKKQYNFHTKFPKVLATNTTSSSNNDNVAESGTVGGPKARINALF